METTDSIENIKIKKAIMPSVVEIDGKIYQLNRKDALELLKETISEQYDYFIIEDTEYVMSSSRKDIFRLIVLFRPITNSPSMLQ